MFFYAGVDTFLGIIHAFGYRRTVTASNDDKEQEDRGGDFHDFFLVPHLHFSIRPKARGLKNSLVLFPIDQTKKNLIDTLKLLLPVFLASSPN